ncbi:MULTISPECIES: hypothetical protein [Delftia]|uniref:Uncharacterized protein n=1 Tax=Delftia lacustris TaxID=558537 RepID=A0A1H3N7V6_9BURK|nr:MULTISPECIES: hypothetical protein [Delftia]QPS78277.1 hypothetical protein I6G48_31635 [Delftia acidovorans]QPS84837.1 hypothetical protein I6G47_32305 [Delftia lacustris]SDY84946.1 hypothetical protein SAMN05421547_108213 [Delftia lacustris]
MNLENMAKQQILVIGARATHEFVEGPQYCATRISLEFLRRLVQVHRLVEEAGLSEARFYYEPDVWGPGDTKEEAKLSEPEVVVATRCFWFSQFAKDADCNIESELMDFVSLEKLLTESAPNELIFVSDELRSLYEEDNGE